jgi:hypothetical protein
MIENPLGEEMIKKVKRMEEGRSAQLHGLILAGC